MLRSMLRKLSHSLASSSSRPARPISCRTTLAIEGLEDRLALSITPSTEDPTSQFGSTLRIEAPNVAQVQVVNSSTPVGAQSDVVHGGGPESLVNALSTLQKRV
jgi:hypothetical protein